MDYYQRLLKRDALLDGGRSSEKWPQHVTTARMRNVAGAMGVFTGNVLNIPGCKILNK